MVRNIHYILLFLAVVLLQIFLFDNLSISIYLNPLVYVAFVVLLPFDIKPVTLLLSAFVLGVVMDWMMGAAGVNTIATLPVAFVRPMLLAMLMGREESREIGVPSVDRMGMRRFVQYLVIMVVLHHTIFFVFEALSWSHLFHTIVRILFSSLFTVGATWLIVRLFTTKIPVRTL